MNSIYIALIGFDPKQARRIEAERNSAFDTKTGRVAKVTKYVSVLKDEDCRGILFDDYEIAEGLKDDKFWALVPLVKSRMKKVEVSHRKRRSF
jgi:hypothetical protein